MNTRKNIFLALASGLLLGVPWSVPPLFFLIFVAWVPLLQLEEEARHNANLYTIFNYSFVSFLLWNILASWWVGQVQWVGAILIILANSLLQALVFWSISRIRTSLKIPLLVPFLFIWMGYEHFHQSWDLAWPWLNLGNALATAPKLIQWYEFAGVRGGTLWIILTNLAAWKVWDTYRKRGLGSIAYVVAGTLLLFFVPSIASYQIYHNFREKGETVDAALIQPNLDPYTEKFVPKKQDQHLKEFFRIADSILDDETLYLFGPETLIVQQIDEKNPSASPHYRQLLDFRKKYPKLNFLLGIHSYQKLSGDPLQGVVSTRKKTFTMRLLIQPFFCRRGLHPNSTTKPNWSPYSSACPLCNIWGSWGNILWNSADTAGPTVLVRRAQPL